MLLSIPTWIIHLSSMLEWLWAITLFYRLGRVLNRRDVSRFGLLMIPHWIGGMCVIIFHLTGDLARFWLDASKLINCIGSISLLYGTVMLNRPDPLLRPPSLPGASTEWLGALLPTIFLFHFLHFHDATHSHAGWYWVGLNDTVVDVVFQLSSAIYLGFLILLLVRTKDETMVISRLSVGGFWFLLVFVSFTVGCIYFATKVRGFPTLTHDDVLHGLAESLLTVSNLMIALGARDSLQKAMSEKQAAPE